jgi:hypothetical protein
LTHTPAREACFCAAEKRGGGGGGGGGGASMSAAAGRFHSTSRRLEPPLSLTINQIDWKHIIISMTVSDKSTKGPANLY